MPRRVVKRQHPSDDYINAYCYLFGLAGDVVTWTSEIERALNPGPWIDQTLIKIKALPGDKSVKYTVIQKEVVQ